MRPALALLIWIAFSLPALAQSPRVVADIPPVHSLVAQVMEGVGTPDLIVPGNASPHGFSLRPRDARALQEADAVIWIGPALTPWMEKAIDSLAQGTATLQLADVPGTQLLPFREEVFFDLRPQDHDHDHDHDHDEESAHDDDHDHGHDHGHDHASGALDPHLWLDPLNARLWLGQIADLLADLDPTNAETYRTNAAVAQARIDTLETDVVALLGETAPTYVVYHDAYQYFETRFGVPATGALALSDAAPPSARRLSQLRAHVEETGVSCILAEPQFDTRLIDTVMQGTATTEVVDPLGAGLTPGPDLYDQLIRNMAARLAGCS